MATKTGSAIESRQQVLKFAGFEVSLTPIGMTFPRDLSFDQWRAVGGHFAMDRARHESVQWALADWLAYGGEKFCERDSSTNQFKITPMFSRYRQVAEATGYAPDTLRFMASVGRSVSKQVRRSPDVLSFSHHVVVASIDDSDMQNELLSKAENDCLSVSELRVEVRRLLAQEQDKEPNLPGMSGPHILSWTTNIERAISRMIEAKPVHSWPSQQRAAIKHDLSAHIAKMQSIVEKL